MAATPDCQAELLEPSFPSVAQLDLADVENSPRPLGSVGSSPQASRHISSIRRSRRRSVMEGRAEEWLEIEAGRAMAIVTA
jgi:hypothetical protein